MAAFLPPVIFEIEAKATQAIAQFQAVNAELDKMQADALKAGGSIDVMTKASKLAGTALLGLGSVFGVFAVASIKELDNVEKAQSNLQTAIKNTGVSYSTAKPYVDAAAASMRNLGFTTQDTYGALATLTAASRNPKTALETLATAADLARFKQISLTDAGTLLARATIGQAKGLGDLGLAIKKTIPQGADLKTILQAVETRTHGAAVAFKTTLAGSIEVAKANFQNLEVEVGTALVPKLESLTTWINDKGLPDLKKLFTFISNNKGTIQDFAIAMGAIWAVGKISAGVSATISAINSIKKAYEGLRAVLITTGIAEAFATAGVSVGTAATALAAVGGLAYLAYETPKVIKDFSGKAAPDYFQQYRPGGSKTNPLTKQIIKPRGLSAVDSHKSPNITSSTASKASARKQAKGITSLGSGAQITGTLTINGSGVGKLAAKSVLTGSTLNKGGR